MTNAPRIGDVYLVRLPTHAPPGHEQQGLRPVVVVAEPERAGRPRFELVYGAPLTTQVEAWTKTDSSLYPLLKAGIAGLPRDSVVLTEHSRGVDAMRVVRKLGALTPDEYTPVKEAVEQMFNFRRKAL